VILVNVTLPTHCPRPTRPTLPHSCFLLSSIFATTACHYATLPQATSNTTTMEASSSNDYQHGKPTEGMCCLCTMEDITEEDQNYGMCSTIRGDFLCISDDLFMILILCAPLQFYNIYDLLTVVYSDNCVVILLLLQLSFNLIHQ